MAVEAPVDTAISLPFPLAPVTELVRPACPADAGVAPELQDHFAVSGEQRVQEEEAQRDLDRAVAALPPRYREVIALFHIQHRSYAEIAQTLGVPMGTVMTWLHRARKELMAKLAEHLS